MSFFERLFSKKKEAAETALMADASSTTIGHNAKVTVLLIGLGREACKQHIDQDNRSAEYETVKLELSNHLPSVLRNHYDVLLLCPKDQKDFAKLIRMAEPIKDQCAVMAATKEGVILGDERVLYFVNFNESARQGLKNLITQGYAEQAKQERLRQESHGYGRGYGSSL